MARFFVGAVWQERTTDPFELNLNADRRMVGGSRTFSPETVQVPDGNHLSARRRGPQSRALAKRDIRAPTEPRLVRCC
jgi:hypothetical protein